MTQRDAGALRLHEDRDFFREALSFTSAETAFPARLIEKDYFCTVVLAYLAGAPDQGLVFKGGTCLAKVHAGFYRLSEDLDFVLDVPFESTRAQRSRMVAGVKDATKQVPKRLPGLRVIEQLRGANSSTQYIGTLGYRSLVREEEESVKFEIGLREPLLTPAADGLAGTILLDPISGNPLVSPVPVRCMSLTEALAEKFRAALSRREVAIRDFFDVDFAVRSLGLNPTDPEFVNLVRRKLGVPGNDSVDVSERRFLDLRRQTESQLRPVLRDRDYASFDLDRAMAMVAEMAKAL